MQAVKETQSDVKIHEQIKNWSIKSFTEKEKWNKELDRYDMNQFYDTYANNGEGSAIAENEIIDLSLYYKNGKLNWEVPEGEWTIIRYGYTSTGRRNNYASEGFKGEL